MRSAVTVCASAALCATGAVAQNTFTPAAAINPQSPPANQSAMNAAQVILGMAGRYVVTLPAQQPARPLTRAAVTTDFVNYTELPLAPNALGSVAAAVSDDGQRVVGHQIFTSSGGSVLRACMWEGVDPPQVKFLDGAFNQNAVGIAGDGSRWLARTGIGQAERSWLIEGGSATPVVPFADDEPQLATYATTLSPDGRTVAGSYNGPQGDTFVWSAAGGGRLLARPFLQRPFPVLVADNAARLVGAPITGGTPVWSNGRWRLISEVQNFNGTAMSGDGRLVAGSTTFGPSWYTETLGVERISQALQRRGVNLLGWTLTTVDYVSYDGRTLVGRGYATPGNQRYWVATVDPVAAADMGRTGGLTGSDGRLDNNDFVVFIDRFFAHDERADVGGVGAERGPDGVFDSNDFCVFVNLFFTGTP